MALSVWNKRGTAYAECTDCGSYGTAAHVKVAVKMEPEIAEALEKHEAHMAALKDHFQRAATELQRKANAGELPRPDAAERYKVLVQQHVKQVQAATIGLPDPAGKVTHLVMACPWCGTPAEAQVEHLSEDQEPPFSLVKLVAQKNKGD